LGLPTSFTFLCFSLIQHTPTVAPLPSLLGVLLLSLSVPFLPQNHSFSISLQKRAGLQGMSTKRGLTSYHQTRHKPSYQSWMRQSIRRKRIPRSGLIQEPMGTDAEIHSQILNSAQGTGGRGRRIVGAKGVKDTRKIQPTESTKQGS
jgi:IS5 family transposase